MKIQRVHCDTCTCNRPPGRKQQTHVRRNDKAAAQSAWDLVWPSVKVHKHHLLQAFAAAGECGASNFELQEETGFNQFSVNRRVSDLIDDGWVEYTGHEHGRGGAHRLTAFALTRFVAER